MNLTGVLFYEYSKAAIAWSWRRVLFLTRRAFSAVKKLYAVPFSPVHAATRPRATAHSGPALSVLRTCAHYYYDARAAVVRPSSHAIEVQGGWGGGALSLTRAASAADAMHVVFDLRLGPTHRAPARKQNTMHSPRCRSVRSPASPPTLTDPGQIPTL